MTSLQKSQALNGNNDENIILDDDAPDEELATIVDPKPRGYTNAFSRHKHALTAQKIIEKHYTVNGVQTLWLVQNSFYHFNGTHYVEWEPHWAKLRIIEHLNAGVVPKPYKRKLTDGIHVGYTLVPYDPINEHVNNTLNQIKSMCKVMPMTSPCWLPGAKHLPPADEIAPVANGLLHMPTGKLLSVPRALLFCTRSSRVTFDPSAMDCPEWDKYLDWLFGADVQARDVQEEMMGYCMVSSNKYQKAFYLSSPGRGGKGTRMEVLEALLGDGAMVACDIADFHPMKDTNLHKCIDAAVMWFDEPTFGGNMDRSSASGKIKAISGGSSVSISRKYLGQWRGRLPGKIIMTGNEGSDLHDSSGVIVDRFIQIHNECSAADLPGGVVPKYFETHLEPEMSAILNRAVAAYARLEERGKFVQPSSSDYIDDNMLENAAPVKDFLLNPQYWEHGREYQTDRTKAFAMYGLYIESVGRMGAGNMGSFSKSINNAGLPGVKACQTAKGELDPNNPSYRKRVIKGIRPTLKYDADRRMMEAPNMIDLESHNARSSA